MKLLLFKKWITQYLIILITYSIKVVQNYQIKIKHILTKEFERANNVSYF